ncbi:nucleoside triphosphate pyrophosphohydrolase [Colwellia sp. MSW7]|jgi:ATP diphosphatase|uniref:Nucleoside triphosphate pyrophosphohydrolase n=1 Tax=Colwellia maritima TaxID=2912588 RepID=A0ABS9WZA2_9GAMM|nr:nucleoside triphosphate pyrophosphohydrolase [Colwellia maritima]MCI2283294.1 nucleoside triphosphate pyrophosphohydrolase [Colwellia maritima]
MLNAKPSIDKLRWIMTQLRDPSTGCPWDLKQSFSSITAHTLEEAYEVVDAIEQNDFVELNKELGDLLFQVIFYSQLGQEQQLFDFDSVVASICEKLIRRHPHVFGDADLKNDSQIKANWENEKAKERQHKNKQENLSVLADIPKNMPALSQAAKIQKRCSHVGFDWDNKADVFAKIEEEVLEVKDELEAEHINPDALGEELGDLMFAVVNLCRHAKQDPETLLRQANQKFTKRFHGVEAQVQQSERDFSQHSLEELEQYWQKVKAQEKLS